jgi:hypothetical protein
MHNPELAMTRRAAFAWMTVVALLTGGCATPWDVDSFEAADGNVAGRQTFFWKGGDFGTPAAIDPQVLDTATAQLRHTITTELARRGYTEAGSATSADMLVSFQVAGSQRSVVADDRRIGAPSPTSVLVPSARQPPPASAVPREMRMRDGSVLVFIEDPADGRLIWRGTATAETRYGSTDKALRTMNQMAQQITRSVPARAGAAK